MNEAIFRRVPPSGAEHDTSAVRRLVNRKLRETLLWIDQLARSESSPTDQDPGVMVSQVLLDIACARLTGRASESADPGFDLALDVPAYVVRACAVAASARFGGSAAALTTIQQQRDDGANSGDILSLLLAAVELERGVPEDPVYFTLHRPEPSGPDLTPGLN